jgi:hypothetical protein
MTTAGTGQDSPSELVGERIAEFDDWRGEMLRRVRKLIKEADPEIVEEWKWKKPSSPGTPVWSHGGGRDIVKCCGSASRARIPRGPTPSANHLCHLQRELGLPI